MCAQVKKTTHFRKLMEAYCARVGAQTAHVRFLFDGNRISPDDTPGNVSDPKKRNWFSFSLSQH